MPTRAPRHERVSQAVPTDRALANTLPQIIWTCDANGQLEWCNDRWYEITGLTEQATLRDKGALEAVHPDDRHVLSRHWEQAIATGSMTELEYRLRNQAGEYRWYFARVTPVWNGATLTRWVAAVLDIHDRRAAEESLRESQQQFDSFFYRNPIPLAITRQSDGVFLLVNDAFVRMTGFTRDEAVGRSSVELELVSANVRTEIATHFSSSDGRSHELPVRRKNGQIMTIMMSNTHLELDGVSCFLNSAVDLTDRRAMEDALREREAQARAAEEALRQANRQKDDFQALLSHELRNPLTPILTSARMLHERVDAEARYEIDVIVRQVKHMSRLIDDLLDVSRVQGGALTLTKTRVEPANVILRAVDAIAPMLQSRGHRLEVAVPERGLAVEGDEVRLTQIFDNLLTNAARFTPPGGVIRVEGEREGDVITLRVRDSGRGIEPALLPYVFDTFVQGPRGPDRAEGGLGLGLALVRALTAVHSGTVSAHSDGPGRGSEFTIRLPAAPKVNTVRATAPGEATRTHGASTRVLVVDDHPDVVNGLARVLTLVGYDVRSALNPLDAIETAEAFRPQVAVLDIGLPMMDGYALARELRTQCGDAVPALIALSGYDQERDRRRSREAGFAMHLAKPIDIDELLKALESVMATSSPV
jgi:PAS domain S-box-containing protein